MKLKTAVENFRYNWKRTHPFYNYWFIFCCAAIVAGFLRWLGVKL